MMANRNRSMQPYGAKQSAMGGAHNDMFAMMQSHHDEMN
jgi:hypothetical protein